MKLHQKVAGMLVTALLVTTTPIITMAASDNRMAKEILRVGKDDILDLATGAAVQIVFKDNWQSVIQDEIFYLELENAEFTDNMFKITQLNTVDGSATIPVEIIKDNSKTAKVVITEATASSINSTKAYSIPLLTKVKVGDAKVSILKKGSSSTVTDGKWTFATTTDKAASLQIGEINAFYNKGNLSPIKIVETFKGSMQKGCSFIIELDDGDWEFSGAGKGKSFTLKAETSFGFRGKEVEVTCTVDKDDAGTLQVDIPPITSSYSLGILEIKNIGIEATVEDPKQQRLMANFKKVKDKGELVRFETKQVAEIIKYSNYIKMKNNIPAKIEAGHAEEVIFDIGEFVDDSLVGARQINIDLSNEEAHFLTGSISIDDERKKNGIAQVIEKIDYEYVDKEKKEKGIKTISVTLKPGLNQNNERDWFRLKAKICVPVDQKDKEAINIVATGRALSENEVSTKAVEIQDPFSLITEEMHVKVGLNGQVGGRIALVETDKGKLNKGDILIQVADDAPKEIKLENVGRLEVAGNLKRAELKEDMKTDGIIRINLARQSKTPTILKLSDIKVSVDRTVPEGKYDLKISGQAIDGHGHDMVVKDFFVVGTPNTEDIAANGLMRGKTIFIVGEAKYTANGIEYDMPAKSYIQDPGYTMIPVRYVAKAFGIEDKDIIFSNGVAVFFAGERTIQLTSGSDVAMVNETPIKMETKVVIQAGRMYAPVSEVAKILGIKPVWDGASKTATFINE